MSSPKVNRGSSGPEQGNPAARKYSGLSRSNHDGPVSFAGSALDLLAAAVDSVTSAGDLLSLSRTSDGGAVCVFVRSGKETFKGYASTVDELNELLTILASDS